MAKKKMDLISLIRKHGDKIPKIQKLLGQKEKLEDQAKTVQKRLKAVDSQLDKLVSTASTAPKRKKKKAVRRKKKVTARKTFRKKTAVRRKKKKAGRTSQPNVGSASYLAAQVMGNSPMKAEQVVAAIREAGNKVNPATVKYNLSHYPFFKNVRGKGYIYKGPAVPGLKKKAGKKAVKRTVKKKAGRRTLKKKAAVASVAPAAETSAT